MTEVTITVRGEHELRVAPERATLHLTVSCDGPDRATVVEHALAQATPVRDGITTREQSGSITAWTSQRLNVYAERPWNSEGKRLAPVYRASIDFTATFSDFPELSVWVTELSVTDGVAVGDVDWHLTPETEREVEREVATQAVAVAVSRARAYAEALGLHEVTPVEIADRGLISAGTPPMPKATALRGGAMAMEAAPGMEFQGEEITVSAEVEGRFTAS
ncbi:SIMPL domain-containing protein [Microbacterium esteraromaticum]|uniref:SIMPL domain-containing protein n=1 Tax=Microbacterium esteraromaticum TaxID=57043 RepID=A0A939DVR7_9MICO|nr:SIMPL domain-containing protein [Microbacterium esteraromaticum]MBN8205902.1 SIMPL domain-containing protein [Microbacterium esteraromaticum]MBN8416057.1 SIMPL domain-containing protein [Microbacterium esteraromaticum]